MIRSPIFLAFASSIKRQSGKNYTIDIVWSILVQDITPMNNLKSSKTWQFLCNYDVELF